MVGNLKKKCTGGEKNKSWETKLWGRLFRVIMRPPLTPLLLYKL